jgi:hypothetical protein
MADTNKIDVNRRHPTYKAMSKYWTYWWNSYLGSFNYVKEQTEDNVHASYLFANEKELAIKDAFARRNNQSLFINHGKDAVNRIIKYIFSGENKPKRTISLDKFVEELRNNVDLEGKNRDKFMAHVLLDSLVTGVGIVQLCRTDSEKINQMIQEGKDIDLATSRAENIRTYWRNVNIEDRIDWKIKDGVYEWVWIRNLEDTSEAWGDRTEKTIYLLYKPDKIYEYNEKGKLITDYPNPFGVVPFFDFIPMDADRNGIPESYISQMADIDRMIYNIISLYHKEMVNTDFPWLAIKSGIAKQITDFVKNLFSGPQNVLIYNDEKPSWLEPTGKTFENKITFIEYLLEEFMRVSGLDKTDASAGSGESGLSKLVSFMDTNMFISAISQGLQNYEFKLDKITSEMEQLKPSEKDDIKYAESFQIRNENVKIDFYKKMIAFFGDNSIVAKFIKKRVLALEKEVPAEIVDTIDKEEEPVIDEDEDEDEENQENEDNPAS